MTVTVDIRCGNYSKSNIMLNNYRIMVFVNVWFCSSHGDRRQYIFPDDQFILFVVI
jgi:hypothetical protein